MTNSSAIEKYNSVREKTVRICALLHTEDFVMQPAEEVSPPKWHLAHTTWFFEELLLSKYDHKYIRFHPQYAFLFNSYYNSIGSRVPRSDRGNISRPLVKEIKAYREYVDSHMVKYIPNMSDEILEVLELGLSHEEQHQELLYTDIKFILGHNPLFPPYDKKFVETLATSTDQNFVTLPEGNYEIGFKGEGFSYDNEKGLHRVFLHSFEVRKNLVTNGEYMEFIADKGYEKSCYWLSDGWAWLHENHITSPLYWHQIDSVWQRYSLSGLEPIDPLEPVTHITYYEATAFAEWANMRLPTEFEWEVASDKFTWGQRWEYTNSAYLPYPNFVKLDGPASEYSGKFMINQMVLRGSSVVTPPNHSRKTYRNFLFPHLGFQFTGIRLCKK